MFEISGNIGIPITLDEATLKRSFGHFPRVLIDTICSDKLKEQVLVERGGFAFLIDVEYEKYLYLAILTKLWDTICRIAKRTLSVGCLC